MIYNLIFFLTIFIGFLFFNLFYFFIDFDFLKVIQIILPIILAIAFFTLFERKILSSLQRRRGPNIVGLYGFLQPIADALKLLLKESIVPKLSNFLIFLVGPLLTFMISLVNWAFIPFDVNLVIVDTSINLFFLFTVSSLGVYGIIISGWSSNSKYAFLGSLRSTAQMISYEVSLGLIVLPLLICVNSLDLYNFVIMQNESSFFVFSFFPSFLMFFISGLAETNRVPFDLPEAESELVSGYNVEYSSIFFALFFLAEYSNILIMSCLIVILFFGGWFVFSWFSWSWFVLKLCIVVFFFIFIRGLLPRYRYDQLMNLGWKVLLPVSLGYLCCIIFIFWY